MSRRRSGAWTAGILLLGLLAATSAQAGRKGLSWSIAERTDDEIRWLIAKLDSVPAPRAEAAEATASWLLKQYHVAARENYHQTCESAVVRVLDPENSEVASRQLLFSPQEAIESAAAWTLRDGRVTRLGKEYVRTLPGNDERPTELVIAFPDVRRGDVIGWSVIHGCEGEFPGTVIALAEADPVRVAIIRVETDGRVVYRIAGRNLPEGSWDLEVLEKTNDADSDIMATILDIEAVRDEPWSPPAQIWAPEITITWRGSFDRSIGRWMYVTSWNELAVWLEELLDELLETDARLKATARELTAGLADPRERLEALHRFVRTEIVPVDEYEMRSARRPAKEVLATRTASHFERGALLFALCRAVDLPVRLVLAHSHDAGTFDQNDLTDFQFTDLLVESTAEPGRFYAPTCAECCGGELPADLRGAPAMVLGDDLAAKDRKIVVEAFDQSSDDDGYLLNKYRQLIAREQWYTMFRTPGDPAAPAGTTTETVRWQAGRDTARVELAGAGLGGLSALRREKDDATQALKAWCEDRFPVYAVVEGRDDPRLAPATRGGVGLQGVVRLPQSGPAGEVWPLPADLICGRRFLDAWSGPERGPFHFTASRETRCVWRMALPVGWKPASLPAPVQVENPRFSFLARAGMANGELVILREYHLRRGTTPREELAALDEAIAAVRRAEQVDLVLVRGTAARGGGE